MVRTNLAGWPALCTSPSPLHVADVWPGNYTSSVSNLAVNEIGPFNGRVPMPGSPVIVVVTSDGNWSITVG